MVAEEYGILPQSESRGGEKLNICKLFLICACVRWVRGQIRDYNIMTIQLLLEEDLDFLQIRSDTKCRATTSIK